MKIMGVYSPILSLIVGIAPVMAQSSLTNSVSGVGSESDLPNLRAMRDRRLNLINTQLTQQFEALNVAVKNHEVLASGSIATPAALTESTERISSLAASVKALSSEFNVLNGITSYQPSTLMTSAPVKKLEKRQDELEDTQMRISHSERLRSGVQEEINRGIEGQREIAGSIDELVLQISQLQARYKTLMERGKPEEISNDDGNHRDFEMVRQYQELTDRLTNLERSLAQTSADYKKYQRFFEKVKNEIRETYDSKKVANRVFMRELQERLQEAKRNPASGLDLTAESLKKLSSDSQNHFEVKIAQDAANQEILERASYYAGYTAPLLVQRARFQTELAKVKADLTAFEEGPFRELTDSDTIGAFREFQSARLAISELAKQRASLEEEMTKAEKKFDEAQAGLPATVVEAYNKRVAEALEKSMQGQSSEKSGTVDLAKILAAVTEAETWLNAQKEAHTKAIEMKRKKVYADDYMAKLSQLDAKLVAAETTFEKSRRSLVDGLVKPLKNQIGLRENEISLKRISLLQLEGHTKEAQNRQDQIQQEIEALYKKRDGLMSDVEGLKHLVGDYSKYLTPSAVDSSGGSSGGVGSAQSKPEVESLPVDVLNHFESNATTEGEK